MSHEIKKTAFMAESLEENLNDLKVWRNVLERHINL